MAYPAGRRSGSHTRPGRSPLPRLLHRLRPFARLPERRLPGLSRLPGRPRRPGRSLRSGRPREEFQRQDAGARDAVRDRDAARGPPSVRRSHRFGTRSRRRRQSQRPHGFGHRSAERDHGQDDPGRAWAGGRGDRASGIAFVTLAQENAVAVIDPALGTLIRKIAVGHHPSGIAVGGNIVAVANPGSRSLTILNAVNLTPISDLTVGRIPRDVAINPLTGVVAVTDESDGMVYLVDIRYPESPVFLPPVTLPGGGRGHTDDYRRRGARGRWASRSTMASASISSSWPTRTATPCISSSSPPRGPSTVSARWTSASGPRRSP